MFDIDLYWHEGCDGCNKRFRRTDRGVYKDCCSKKCYYERKKYA